jgi:glycerol-3-phosphate acyltransferase PlsY
MSWIEHFHSTNWNQATGIFLCSYLLGCFATGYYLVRWMAGKDIRETGSGSVGARNVGRVLGKTGFFLTALFDFLKGILAVWATRHFTTDDRLAVVAMLAVVIGHVWPMQLRFHGGKGMATCLGSLLVYDPYLTLVFVVLFLCLCVLLRRTVLPGLFALAFVPLAGPFFQHQPATILLLSLWAGVVLFAHRRNFVEEFSQFAARRGEQTEPGQHL